MLIFTDFIELEHLHVVYIPPKNIIFDVDRKEEEKKVALNSWTD